jgi:hypothetical protein
MGIQYFTSEQLSALHRELDKECAEYEREHGLVTAAQRNQIAARLMETARNEPSSVPSFTTVGPHGS